MKTYTLDQMLDKHIGKKGTPERERFEAESNAELQSYFMGEAIKKARISKNLTQEQLGERMGVQKAQVSRLENGKDIRVSTLTRALQALGISAELRLNGGKMGRVALC